MTDKKSMFDKGIIGIPVRKLSPCCERNLREFAGEIKKDAEPLVCQEIDEALRARRIEPEKKG